MPLRPPPDDADPIRRLIAVMARLRDPDGGCPWDLAQDIGDIAPYTIEEAYEVADAIEREDWAALEGELGDLLFQVVYYAQFGRERAQFDFDTIAASCAEKMIARHPHVFAVAETRDAAAQTTAWEMQKAAERAAKAAAAGETPSVLDDLPLGLPAATRALKLQRRAARVGFDWRDAAEIFDKLREELAEAEAAAASGDDAAIADELGDLLFVCVNLCRRYDVDPETALRGCNAKFERRFRDMETRLAADGAKMEDAGLERLERLWAAAKEKERS